MRSTTIHQRKLAFGLAIAALMICGCKKSPEARSAAFMDTGKKFLEKKDTTRAILQFRNAAQATPKNAEVYYQLGIAYLTAGDIRNGLFSLHRTLELNPKHAGARLRMGVLTANANDPTILRDSQKRLEALLKDENGNVEALHALALTELKLGESQNAMEHLQRALTLAPQSTAVAVMLSQAKIQAKDIKGGEEVLKKNLQANPKSSEAATVLGEFYASQTRMGEAEQLYRQASTLDPTSALPLWHLAMLQLGQGRKQEAEQNFKRLSGLADKEFKQEYAIFLFHENRTDEALREFNRLVKEDPEDRVARTRLIAAYRSVNREADARGVLEAALKKNPKDSDALLQKAELWLAAGKYTEAEADLNKVTSLNPDSAEARYIMAKLRLARGEELRYREDLFKAVELNPYFLTARLELAAALTAGKNSKRAIEVLDAAPEAQRQQTAVLVQRNWALWTSGDLTEMRKGIDLGLSRERSTDLLLQDALWKLQKGNAPAARTVLEEALKLDPTNVRALRALNATYNAQKQGAVALQKVKEYAAQQPKSAPIQEFLGTLLMANGDLKQARVAFEAATAADPKSVRAVLSLVQADVAEEKLDDAQRRLGTVLNSGGGNSVARLWMGNLELEKRNPKAALEHFRQAVAEDPSNVQALNNLAYLLSEFSNQPSEALRYAQKASELAPDNPEYQDTLGWVLYRCGVYPSAVTQLERATSKDGDAVWKYHLAMAYAKAGDLPRGRTTLQAALRQNPNLPEAQTARNMLKTGN